MNLSKQSNWVLIVVLCVVIGVMATISRGNSATAEPQDVMSLDRRLSSLEQRFYMVESNISRLQTYLSTQRPPVSQPSTNDRDILLMREEIQRLSLRVNELECGLAKLDERTTPASRRNTTDKPTDPCRMNVTTPIHLSAHP